MSKKVTSSSRKNTEKLQDSLKLELSSDSDSYEVPVTSREKKNSIIKEKSDKHGVSKSGDNTSPPRSKKSIAPTTETTEEAKRLMDPEVAFVNQDITPLTRNNILNKRVTFGPVKQVSDRTRIENKWKSQDKHVCDLPISMEEFFRW
jgi:hypothetical protein